MICPQQLPSSPLRIEFSPKDSPVEKVFTKTRRWLHLIFRIARMSYRAAVYQSFLRMGKESRVFFFLRDDCIRRGNNKFSYWIETNFSNGIRGSLVLVKEKERKKEKIKSEKKISR